MDNCLDGGHGDLWRVLISLGAPRSQEIVEHDTVWQLVVTLGDRPLGRSAGRMLSSDTNRPIARSLSGGGATS